MTTTLLLQLTLAGVFVTAHGRYLREAPSLPNDIHLSNLLSKLQARVTVLEQKIEKPTPKPNKSDEVGFHTTLSKKAVVSYGDTIIFDHAITNLGAAYNTTSGEFVCPKTGTYLFNLNILSNSKSDIEAAIFKANSNEHVLITISYNQIDGSYRQGGGSAILKLAKDEVILVRKIARLGKHTLLADYSYFSGYLLRSS